jgi:hypothetical protein
VLLLTAVAVAVAQELLAAMEQLLQVAMAVQVLPLLLLAHL